MATELIQLAVGDYDVTYEGFHSGVFLRDVTAKPLTAKYLPLLDADARRSWTGCRRGPATTRSTSTGRWWSTPTSASRWRPRRSS